MTFRMQNYLTPDRNYRIKIKIYEQIANYYLLCSFSSETVSFFLPLLLRAESTLLPLAVDILSRKPCLLRLFRVEGWYVLFMTCQK